MFTGIEHVAIASPDPKRLAEWYCETLAFRINYEYDGNYFIKAANGALLEIVPAQGQAGLNDKRTPGLRHVAISVANFDQAYAELQRKGVSFTGEPYLNQGNRLVFFTDVDGNHIHLIERAQPLP